MKATVLIDNLTQGTLLPEWGLSIYIEYEGHKILLDTGASDKFARNASKLGIDLSNVEFGVLSHAHYDHADGMSVFFENNAKASFYLREGTQGNCYGKRWIFHKYIGIQKKILKDYRDRIIYVSADQEVISGVRLLPHHTKGLEQFGKKNFLYVKKGIRYFPDSFEHEQSLVFETGKGLVIFNSCSHGGADNIIQEVAAAYPGRKIYALIGGFHLYHSTEEEIRALADRIRQTGIQKIYTGHCTGQPAYDILKEQLGEQAEQLKTGMEILV
ncbi:MAG: MBL fold metallo-hydrolase [Lachnospiraceae bacterium]|nr:MBL fold metallo-hydrolase [Lachnospiraceae bacterium]